MKMTAKSLYANYLLPAIFLNPILFLHSLNTILSRILPPIQVMGSFQPPPYSDLGPSACHPHLDVHYSDNLCWSYTIVMVIAQLFAFDRVTQVRSEKSERGERGEKGMEDFEQEAGDNIKKESSQSNQSNQSKPRQTNGAVAGDRKQIAREGLNGSVQKHPGWALWREESSSENDSLPPK